MLNVHKDCFYVFFYPGGHKLDLIIDVWKWVWLLTFRNRVWNASSFLEDATFWSFLGLNYSEERNFFWVSKGLAHPPPPFIPLQFIRVSPGGPYNVMLTCWICLISQRDVFCRLFSSVPSWWAGWTSAWPHAFGMRIRFCEVMNVVVD